MKKLFQIALIAVIICLLASSCASSRKAPLCPAYGNKSNNFERKPF